MLGDFDSVADGLDVQDLSAFNPSALSYANEVLIIHAEMRSTAILSPFSQILPQNQLEISIINNNIRNNKDNENFTFINHNMN